MKSRRKIGPKKQRNRRALLKYLFFAFLAILVGVGLWWVLRFFIGPAPLEDGGESVSILYRLPGMVLILTILIVLGFLFFGIRGYMMGIRLRRSVQSSRMKLRR